MEPRGQPRSAARNFHQRNKIRDNLSTSILDPVSTSKIYHPLIVEIERASVVRNFK